MKVKTRISVFRRLYIWFAAIMLLIYIVFIALSAVFIRRQQHDLSSELSAAVQNKMNSLEDQLESVYNLERIILRDDHLDQLANNQLLNQYEVSQQVHSLNDMLLGYETMTPVIDSIQLVIPSRSMLITSSQGYQYYEYNKTVRATGSTVRSLIVTNENASDPLMLEMMYPMTFSLDENYIPSYGIRVLLSREYFDQQLELFESDKTGTFFIVDNGNGYFLISNDNNENENVYGLIKSEMSKKQNYPAGSSPVGANVSQAGNYWYSSMDLPAYGISLFVYRSLWELYRPIFIFSVIMTALLLLISLFFLYFLRQANRTVNMPLRKIVSAFEEVRDGKLDVRIYHQPQDEFQYIYESFNATVSRIGELMDHVKEQAALLQNAELLQLQSQINPHFLYNSFHLLRIMAKNEDYETILEFVTSLARYYRFLNKETEQNITLEKEADHMKNYIEIQQMRFGDKITVECEPLPESVRAFKVPKLILQPLIENAYNYGVRDLLAEGLIRIRFRTDEKKADDGTARTYLHILVEDNGESVSDSDLERIRKNISDYQGEAAGHALTNIDRRLRLAFGEDSGLTADRSDLGGLKIELVMNMGIQL